MADDRNEHLAWCKKRAITYLDTNCPPQEAVASLLSDLGKHKDTKNHGAIGLTVQMMMAGLLTTDHAVRTHIQGFH